MKANEENRRNIPFETLPFRVGLRLTATGSSILDPLLELLSVLSGRGRVSAWRRGLRKRTNGVNSGDKRGLPLDIRFECGFLRRELGSAVGEGRTTPERLAIAGRRRNVSVVRFLDTSFDGVELVVDLVHGGREEMN
jgi:hypothetical protein